MLFNKQRSIVLLYFLFDYKKMCVMLKLRLLSKNTNILRLTKPMSHCAFLPTNLILQSIHRINVRVFWHTRILKSDLFPEGQNADVVIVMITTARFAR
jgi:hypothetical protein